MHDFRHFNRFQLVSFLLPLLSVLQPSAAASDSDCTCYQTSLGQSPLLFKHYSFNDFRNIPSEKDRDFSKPPPSITASQNGGSELASADYFTQKDFTDYWGIQTWTQKTSDEAPISMVNSAQNIYILTEDDASASATTHITLRTTRLADFQSVSELSSVETSLLHASIRVRARVTGSSGAVAGLFLYYDARNETDTELRTRDPDHEARLTNQPGTDPDGQIEPEASSIVGIPFPAAAGSDGKPSKPGNATRGDWNEYRIDWSSGLTEWIVNNVSVARKSYGVPTMPSHFNINMWSNGGEWSGEMKEGDEAAMDIEWVEVVYNVSGEATPGDDGCKVVCGVDGQAGLGSPRAQGTAMKMVGSVQLLWTIVLGLVLWFLG